ncbi:MAG: hypothetical protein AAFR69_09295, partial [Pseudomonadota bacterium]
SPIHWTISAFSVLFIQIPHQLTSPHSSRGEEPARAVGPELQTEKGHKKGPHASTAQEPVTSTRHGFGSRQTDY